MFVCTKVQNNDNNTKHPRSLYRELPEQQLLAQIFPKDFFRISFCQLILTSGSVLACCVRSAEPADRKLSKIETLRLATSYISHLHTILLVGLDCVEQPCIKVRGWLHGRCSKQVTATGFNKFLEPQNYADLSSHVLSRILNLPLFAVQHQALMERRLDEDTRRLMRASSVCTFCLSASKLKNQHVSTRTHRPQDEHTHTHTHTHI